VSLTERPAARFTRSMSLTQYLSTWNTRKRAAEERRVRHRRHAIQAPRVSGVFCIEDGRFEDDAPLANAAGRGVVVRLKLEPR
jgi:hypothetical protein